jgi:hypothetical protein
VDHRTMPFFQAVEVAEEIQTVRVFVSI